MRLPHPTLLHDRARRIQNRWSVCRRNLAEMEVERSEAGREEKRTRSALHAGDLALIVFTAFPVRAIRFSFPYLNRRSAQCVNFATDGRPLGFAARESSRSQRSASYGGP